VPPVAALALLSLVAAAAPSAADELWERRWIEVRTPHFTLASALDEERTTELARDLENFRRAAEWVTNVGRFDERIPTHVYVFPRRVGGFGLTRDTAAYLLGTMRANHAVIMPDRDVRTAEMLKHEYVHFLMHNRDQLLYPTWYDEGFAQLLSTLLVRDGVLEYGAAPKWTLEALARDEWIGFDLILDTRDTRLLEGRRKWMFYAQSWLLVHYLTLGRKGQDLAAQNTRFLALSEQGTPPRDAFEQAFDVKASRLERTLKKHLGRLPTYKVTLKEPPSEAAAAVRELPGDEIAARLGRLQLARGDVEGANRFLTAALSLNPDNAVALVGRGGVYRQAGRFAEAEPFYRRALSLEPENALHELDLGEYFLARARSATDPEAARGDLASARYHFARSHRFDSENPEPLAMHGASYLGSSDPEDAKRAVASLEAAHERLPSDAQIKLLLARAYLAAREPERARALLRAVRAWAESSSAVEAGELLAGLEVVPRAE
jgi:Flp pilus assembly protein TadD